MEKGIKKSPASKVLPLILVLAVFFLIIVGIYWLLGGLGNGDGKFILYGSFLLILGFIISGRA